MGRFAGAAAKFVGRKYPTADGGGSARSEDSPGWDCRSQGNKKCGPKVKPGKPRRIRRKDGQGLNAPNSYGGNRHV